MITKVRVGIPPQDPLFAPNDLHSAHEGIQTNHHYIYKAISPPGWWFLFYFHKRHICKSVLIVLVHIIKKRMTHP